MEKTVEMSTCWIAAEHALQHVERNLSQIERTFQRYNIRKSQYVVYAGFDESCIQTGSGYLQQVHIFTLLSAILPTSPLLMELGKVLSPFSSILFTESSSFSLPVYKNNGTLWEFDELVFETASKHIDHGSTAAMYPTVISLSQTKGNEPQQGSGSEDKAGVEKDDSQGRAEKGKGRDNENRKGGRNPDDHSGDGDHDSGDKDSGDPDPEGETKGTTGPPKIAFEIDSRIYSTSKGHQSKTLQAINTAGVLTMGMDNNPMSPKCQVRFTKLEFGSETPTPDVAYHQFHCRVTIDSRKKSSITDHNPRPTRATDKESLVTLSSKETSTKTGGGTLGVSTSQKLPLPNFNISAIGNYEKADEEGTASTRKHFNSRITRQARLGVVWWGFTVDDPHQQQGGAILEEPELPTATFHFREEANKNMRVPQHIDVEVASYWSIIPSQTVTSNRNWLSMFFPPTSNDSPVPQYSNLCQMTALNIPSDLKQNSDYCAIIYVENTGERLHFIPDISHPGSESVEIRTELMRSTDSNPFKYGKRFTVAEYLTSETLSGDVLNECSLELPSLRNHLSPSDNMCIGPPPQRRKDARQSAASGSQMTNEH